MNATNATINTATVTTAKITNVELKGTITGEKWNITPEGLATFEGGITLKGVITGEKWNVTEDGKATFEDINATGGIIAGFTIEGKNLKAEAGTKLIIGDSEIWFNQNTMSIWAAGELYLFSDSKEVTLNGGATLTINSGTIASNNDLTFKTKYGSITVSDILGFEGQIESLWEEIEDVYKAISNIDECNCSSI